MASPAVRTTLTELPESRVRVEAEVEPREVERRLEQAARALGREMRVPGFRRGKVPAPMVLKRVGREAVLDEAVRESLAGWYVEAIDDAGVVPIGDPKLDLGELPGEGEPFSFSVEIGVRPSARLGEYRGIEVGRREPEVSEEAIQAEVDALRERLAKLETVDRPAAEGDFVVIDFVGTVDGEPFEGGEARDHLLELGSGKLIEGFESQLAGVTAGEERTVEVTFPGDYRAEHLAGRTASFAVTVKEVKAKELPEADDDFASDAAGFDTLEELREDISEKLADEERREIDAAFREAALDAVVARSDIEVPAALAEARAHELFEQTIHQLGHRGISKEAYLQIAGRPEEEIVAEARPEAEQALKREAVLAAVVEAEGIDPIDADVLAELEGAAERERTTPKKLLERLKQAGRLEDVRRDLATRRALDVIAESAQPIPVEQAKARDQLWTPEKEAGETAPAGRLWTPGS